MNITKTTPVVGTDQANSLELVIDWNTNPLPTEIQTDSQLLIIIQWITLLDEYKKRLDEDWNKWCNVEPDMVMEVVRELNLTLIDEEDIMYYWANHTEYDFMDTMSGYNVYIYDENGVKFNTEITR